MIFKQEPAKKSASKLSPEEVLTEAFKAQNITEEHINDVTKDIHDKQTLIKKLDEATSALETAISRMSRPKEEIDKEKEHVLKLVKKDFIKQQKFFMAAMQKVFPNQQKEAELVLNVSKFETTFSVLFPC